MHLAESQPPSEVVAAGPELDSNGGEWAEDATTAQRAGKSAVRSPDFP